MFDNILSFVVGIMVGIGIVLAYSCLVVSSKSNELEEKYWREHRK